MIDMDGEQLEDFRNNLTVGQTVFSRIHGEAEITKVNSKTVWLDDEHKVEKIYIVPVGEADHEPVQMNERGNWVRVKSKEHPEYEPVFRKPGTDYWLAADRRSQYDQDDELHGVRIRLYESSGWYRLQMPSKEIRKLCELERQERSMIFAGRVKQWMREWMRAHPATKEALKSSSYYINGS